jgi:uncharacterized protein YegL
MPRLDDNMETHNIGGSSFSFSGTRVDHLQSTEYTLVTIAVDTSGSVSGFAAELHNMVVAAVEACKHSPRSDNILVRVVTFSSLSINELHGFKPLSDIDIKDYPSFNPGGLTPLNDAVYSSMGATNLYAKQLFDMYYNVNAIFFVITDGQENASSVSEAMVKHELELAVTSEKLESVLSILIGINMAGLGNTLKNYQTDTDMSMFIDAGTADAKSLAKLAKFVASSVSSQSQSLGTGGPSQNISATI